MLQCSMVRLEYYATEVIGHCGSLWRRHCFTSTRQVHKIAFHKYRYAALIVMVVGAGCSVEAPACRTIEKHARALGYELARTRYRLRPSANSAWCLSANPSALPIRQTRARE